MIQKVQKGSSVGFMDTQFANNAIEHINKVENLQIRFGSHLGVAHSDSNITITIPRYPDNKTSQSAGGGFDGQTYGAFVCESGQAVFKEFFVSS